jgi:cytochrome c-type biogenesis protein CcmH/NrfG
LDPVTAFALASAAFKGIKAAVQVGKEIQEVSGQIGKWYDAVGEFNKAAQPKPAAKKLFSKPLADESSVESEALNVTLHKQKILEMERELYQMILYTYGRRVYDDMIAERRRIAHQRKAAVEKAAREQRERQVRLMYIGAIIATIVLLVVVWQWAFEAMGEARSKNLHKTMVEMIVAPQ